MRTSPRVLSCALRALSLGAFVLTTHLLSAAKPAWKPVTPAELAETTPRLEKEAPAEALFMRMEIDDSDFPEVRKITETIRYKIYAPDKAESITRVSRLDSNASSDRFQVRARLTLPDGRTQEFGDEAIKERTVAKQGREAGFLGWLSDSGVEVKEKFLAITGVEPGAILDYQIIRRAPVLTLAARFSFQRAGVPVRELSYSCRVCPDANSYGNRTFVINSHGAQLKEDRKTRTVSLTATDLPSIVREPFVGPSTDYALTILHCYEKYERKLAPRSGKVNVPGTIDPKLGPWAPHATLNNWYERDRGYATPRVKQMAAEITADLTDPLAKAVAIHEQVQALYQQHRRRPGPRPAERLEPTSLDDVLEVEKKPEVIRFADEFVWLGVALYQSAGFECHAVLLPDRTFARFDPRNISPAFLPHRAIAVRIGDQWRFSAPHTINRQPFGMLPWEQEGQLGLLALEKKQEFIRVPATPPEQSVITSTGKFKIDAAGVLTGECTRSYSGQTAVALRGELRKSQKTRREAIAAGRLGLDPKVAEVKIAKIEALDEAEKPLVITARVRWPGFAVRTKDRLVLRPEVFRAEAGSPFTAEERRHPIHFPYRWQEFDRIEIQLPAGFEPEAPSAPAPSLGEALRHELKLSYDKKNRTLHVGREFTSHILDLAVEEYRPLKNWYDRITRADQHEIVFNRRVATAVAPTANPGN